MSGHVEMTFQPSAKANLTMNGGVFAVSASIAQKCGSLQGCLIKMPLRAIRVRWLALRLLVERKDVAHFVTFGC